MRRSGSGGPFLLILLFAGAIFFALIGLVILDHAPVPDADITPTIAEDYNETSRFSQPILTGWTGVAIIAAIGGVLAVIGTVLKVLRFRI